MRIFLILCISSRLIELVALKIYILFHCVVIKVVSDVRFDRRIFAFMIWFRYRQAFCFSTGLIHFSSLLAIFLFTNQYYETDYVRTIYEMDLFFLLLIIVSISASLLSLCNTGASRVSSGLVGWFLWSMSLVCLSICAHNCQLIPFAAFTSNYWLLFAFLCVITMCSEH